MTNITSLGERDETFIQQGDILSSMNFSKNGKFLAIGDYGGRCIVFQTNQDENNLHKQQPPINYDYYMEFQAHER